MAIGLMTGVAMWASVQLINDHARNSYAQADQVLGAQADFWIRDDSADGVRVEDYVMLRRAGFHEVYPVIEARIPSADGDLINIIATDLLALPLDDLSATPDQTQASRPPFSETLISGRQWLPLIQPGYQAWYPSGLAQQLGIAEGDRLKLSGNKVLPPAVIQNRRQQGPRIFMDVGAALSVLDRSTFSYLAVTSLDAGRRVLLEQHLSSSLMLVENQQALDLSQLTSSLHTNLDAMGLLSFVVGLFIVFNAVRFSLLTRQSTFTTLRELGVSSAMLGAAIVIETLLWSLFGTAIGIWVGYALSGLLLPMVASSLQALFGAVLGTQLTLTWNQMLMAWALTLVGLGLALAAPMWSRAKVSLLASRSPAELLSLDEKARWLLFKVALALLVAAAILFPLMNSVIAGFLVLSLIVFAGACGLPAILHLAIALVLRCLPHSSWRTQWSVSDAFAQLPQLRIALMALLLTLTANIGVSTLVSSFRFALSDWLEVRLSADIYVQGDSLDMAKLLEATAGNPRNTHAADAQPSWLKSAHERMSITTRWQNRPTRVEGLDASAPDTLSLLLADESPHGFSEWLAADAIQPQLILANEQVRYLGGVELKQLVLLETPLGPKEFRIAGFFHDYGSSSYRFYLPGNTFRAHWPLAQSTGLALWIESNGLEEAEQTLTNAGAKPGDWIRQVAVKQISLAIFDRTFAITSALNSLTLLVAGIALLAALLAIHQQRLPEYAHWHSLGMRFSEWLGLVALPLLLLLLVTGLLALPLGWMLSWMLIHELNVMSFGWTMPLIWSWTPVLWLAAVTFAVVTLALCFSALRVHITLPAAIKQLASDS